MTDKKELEFHFLSLHHRLNISYRVFAIKLNVYKKLKQTSLFGTKRQPTS